MRKFVVFIFPLTVAGVGIYLLATRGTSLHQKVSDANIPSDGGYSNATQVALTAQKIPAATASNFITIASDVESDYVQRYMERVNADHDFDWKQPINFFGKVVDENGQPVADAVVKFIWNDISTNGSSESQTVSESSGLFSLRDKRGKCLDVYVSKDEYYGFSTSHQFFEYARPYNGRIIPDPAKPYVFQLRKKGSTEPLIRINKSSLISKDGTPTEVDLKTENKALAGANVIKIECWTKDGEKNQLHNNYLYDWKCRVSVPAGGLIQSTNEFPFEAPLAGYQSADEINMPASLGSAWNNQVIRNYFVKFNDGHYAYIEIAMVAAGDHFFQLTSLLNPSGSRNLEYDSAKRIDPTY